MNRLLRSFKILYTKKQSDNYDKMRLTRVRKQLKLLFKGKKSEIELQAYMNKLALDELEILIITKKGKHEKF